MIIGSAPSDLRPAKADRSAVLCGPSSHARPVRLVLATRPVAGGCSTKNNLNRRLLLLFRWSEVGAGDPKLDGKVLELDALGVTVFRLYKYGIGLVAKRGRYTITLVGRIDEDVLKWQSAMALLFKNGISLVYWRRFAFSTSVSIYLCGLPYRSGNIS